LYVGPDFLRALLVTIPLMACSSLVGLGLIVGGFAVIVVTLTRRH
jgi:hypothetical protein